MKPEALAEWKKITGHDTPEEMRAFEKGYDAHMDVVMEWIKKWDGAPNSGLGFALRAKFQELQDKNIF